MSDAPHESSPGAPGWRPKRSDQVSLHEVASAREGTRFVLKHEERGGYVDLPHGVQDAFVWARLDGRSHIGQLAQQFLEEFDSIHPDLGGLLDRLLEAGMLQDDLPKGLVQDVAGHRLTELAARLAMVRVPIPATAHVWRVVGRAAAPFYSRAAGILAALVGVAGLVLALGPWRALGASAPLLEFPTASSASILAGLALLVVLNIAIDLFEAIAQVAVLARGKRAPGRIGLSFDLGVPGIYIETPDAILLPLEQRVWLLLSPLLAAGFVGGLATIGLWRLHAAPHGEAQLLPLVLHKLAWVAWLRCAVHLNPLTPSPLYDALRAWWSLPHLRRLALRTLRGQAPLGRDEDGGFTARDLAVLTYLGLSIVYFVVVARLGLYLLHSELMPEWTVASAAGDTSRVALLAVLVIILGVPTLLAVGGGLLMSLQAGLRALSRSELFSTPGRLALALAVGALLLASLPRFGAEGVRAAATATLVGLSVFLAGLTQVEGLRLRRASGRGWGALGGLILAFTGASLAALLLLLLINGQNPISHLALAFGVLTVALGGISWAGLEVARAFGAKALTALGVLAAACLPLGMLQSGHPEANPLIGPLLLPALSLLSLAALGGLAACLGSRGGSRAAGLALVSLGFAALACGTASLWLTDSVEPLLRPTAETFGGLHMPFLGAALLAAGTWLLRAARARPGRLPEFTRALDPAGGEAAEVAACRFVLEGLFLGLRDTFGACVAAAAARQLEEADRIRLRGADANAEDLATEEPPAQRARRYRMGAAAFYRAVRERTGDKFCERVMARVVALLPAVAHDAIAESAPSALPILGSMSLVPQRERVRLLRRAVAFFDFDDETLGELANWLGLRWAKAGERLIRQGEIGDTFYVMARGRARVVLEDAGGDERPIAALSSGDAFGEAALLRHEPRSATVIAEGDCLVLTLDRGVFAAFMQGHKALLAGVFARQDDLRLVREIPLFAGLSGEQVSMLCRRLRPESAAPQATVIVQGEAGECFYLVREGQLEVRHTSEGGEVSVIAELERGDYFGEIALLGDSPRTATVAATRPCELLVLERGDFHELLSGRARGRLASRSFERLRELEASSGIRPALGGEEPA